jgi:hypothetical protein
MQHIFRELSASPGRESAYRGCESACLAVRVLDQALEMLLEAARGLKEAVRVLV